MYRCLTRAVIATFALALCGVCTTAVAQAPESIERAYEEVQVSDDWVWVPGHHGSDGVWIVGFYREPDRAGEIWVEPHENRHGINVPGHWIQQTPEDGESYRWESGHRDDDGAWVPGFWRLEEVEGFEWISGYYEDGLWISSHWRPTVAEEAAIWVPGHTVPGERLWRIGFWRSEIRDGYLWVDGYYADNLWYGGYWSPIHRRTGFVWVPGYPMDFLWQLGFWRPISRAGFSWAPGHWSAHHWVAGHWTAGAWSHPAHIILSHYAHYHHTHGHGHDHGHKATRHTRYVAHHRRSRGGAKSSRAVPTVIVKPKSSSGNDRKAHIWSETAQPRSTPARRRPAEGRENEARRPLPATNPRYDRPPIHPRKERSGAASRDSRSPSAKPRRGHESYRAPARKPPRSRRPATRTDRSRVTIKPVRKPTTRRTKARRARPSAAKRRAVKRRSPKRPKRVKTVTRKKRPVVRVKPTKRGHSAAKPVPVEKKKKKKTKARPKKRPRR